MKQDSLKINAGSLVSRCRRGDGGVVIRILGMAVLMGALLQSTIRAADSYWTNAAGGSFGTPANWIGGVPGAGDNANFTNFNASPYFLYFDTGADIMNANAWFNNGGAAYVYVYLNYGHSWTLTNSFVVGQSAGSTGAVRESWGSLLVTNSAGTAAMVVGQSGVGVYLLQGGTVTADRLWVTNGASSAFTFDSGTLNTLHGAIIGNGTDFTVGSINGGTAIWNILGGTNVTTSPSVTYIGNSVGGAGVGQVNVSGLATVWTNSGQLRLGMYAGNNQLVVSNGAKVYNTSVAYLGTSVNASSNNTVTVTGSNSLFSVGGFIEIGNNGWGNKLTIADGGQVVNGSGDIGAASSNNTVTVTGTNSLWNSASVTVGGGLGGGGGGNQLIIQNGGEVRAGNTIIGQNAASTGNLLLVSGGTLTVTNAATSLDVRWGALTLNSGTVNVNSLFATNGANSVVNFNGGTLSAGAATIANGSVFKVGDGSGNKAILNVLGATNVFLVDSILGNSAGSTGSVLLSGGQLVTTNSAGNNVISVGGSGVGGVTVSNGAWLANGVTVGNIGGSAGTLTLVGGTNLFSGNAILGNAANATGTVTMTGGNLAVTNTAGTAQLVVGASGQGTFTLNGGTVTADQLLVTNGANSVLNFNSGTLNTKASTVSGGSTFMVGNGSGSKATLNLLGGANVFLVDSVLGNSAGSTGSVLMSSGQWVTTNSAANNVISVGGSGVGGVTVSNGAWLANGVTVGNIGGSAGTLTLIGGTNLFSGNAILGNAANATGTVTMTGGNLAVTNTAGTAQLVVGASGQGTFTLNGGTVTTVRLLATNGASSTVNFYSGTLNTLHGVTVGSALTIGSGSGGTAIWNILGGTNVTSPSGGLTFIGDSTGGDSVGKVTASGPTTVWTNNAQLRVGTYRPNNTLVITNGTQVFNGSVIYIGTYDVGGVNVSSNNAITVTGSNSLLSSSDFIAIGIGGAGNKLTIADGGQVVVASRASVMGSNPSSSNNTALVTDANSLWDSIASITVGSGGSGNQLTLQNGGEVRAGGMIIGENATSTGNLILVSGGTLTVTNASTSLDVRRGALTLNSGTVNVNSLFATNGAASAVNFNGGTLAVKSTTVSNGAVFVVGNGVSAATLDLLGGTHSFNNGLSVSSGSTLMVTNVGGATLNGVVTNLGTMTVLNSRAIYQGNVVNLGAYVSDPSTNTFNGNFTVGPTATVTAAANDVYAFGGDFTMQSTNRAFNMSTAVAYFGNTNYGITTGTTNHTLSLAGSGAVDMGSNWLDHTQLATNFSIGTLTIASGNRLTLTGGAGTNALYVGVLDLSAWATNASALTNTLQAALNLDINLYYDKYAPNNAYLQGVEFGFWGGGGLLIPIPEPSALALTLAAGALSVFILRRKDRRE